MTNRRTGEHSYQHGRMDALMPVAEQFGVQAWSQGPIYPCVIAVIERYTDTGEFRSRSFELTLDGHSEEYASHDDAEQVAKALLASSAVRYQWSKGEL